MTVFSPDQLLSDYKSGVAAWFAVAHPALRGFEAVLDLNLQATKAALAEYEDHLKAGFGSTNPAEFMTRQLGASPQAVGKAASYGRHLFDIATTTQAEWSKVAYAQYEQADKRLKDALGELTKHAPPGSAAVVAAVNTALSTASAAAETMRAATGQVIEAAQNGFDAVGASAPSGKAGPAGNARKESTTREAA